VGVITVHPAMVILTCVMPLHPILWPFATRITGCLLDIRKPACLAIVNGIIVDDAPESGNAVVSKEAFGMFSRLWTVTVIRGVGAEQDVIAGLILKT